MRLRLRHARGCRGSASDVAYRGRHGWAGAGRGSDRPRRRAPVARLPASVMAQPASVRRRRAQRRPAEPGAAGARRDERDAAKKCGSSSMPAPHSRSRSSPAAHSPAREGAELERSRAELEQRTRRARAGARSACRRGRRARCAPGARPASSPYWRSSTLGALALVAACRRERGSSCRRGLRSCCGHRSPSLVTCVVLLRRMASVTARSCAMAVVAEADPAPAAAMFRMSRSAPTARRGRRASCRVR